MNITLYNTIDEPNKLSKNLNEIATVSGTIINDCSILEPNVRVKNINQISDANYVYIPSLKRYYYIMDLIHDSNLTCILRLKVDVLMSHASDILSTTQIVDRQENMYNLYLNDDMYRVYNKERVTIKEFEGENDFTKTLKNIVVLAGSN